MTGRDSVGIEAVVVAVTNAANGERWRLAEAGDTVQAVRLLTWFDARPPPFDEKIMLAPYGYLARARVEERRGRTQAAVAAYRRFLVRYDLPAPAQRGLIEEARAAVQLLSTTNPNPPDP